MEIEKKIQVSVVMGSQSDWLTMQGACDILQKFNVSFEKKIVSGPIISTPNFKNLFLKVFCIFFIFNSFISKCFILRIQLN